MRLLRDSLKILSLIAAIFLGSGVLALAEQRLALKGYDPVAYFTEKRAMLGDAQHQYNWDGSTYRFASTKHLELFKADPVHYAPEFGNHCAMALAEGELVEANPENWLISDGKLYIFGKPAPMGPALFQQDLAANIGKANKNRALLQGH